MIQSESYLKAMPNKLAHIHHYKHYTMKLIRNH